jgi:hypothetical protein
MIPVHGREEVYLAAVHLERRKTTYGRTQTLEHTLVRVFVGKEGSQSNDTLSPNEKER